MPHGRGGTQNLAVRPGQVDLSAQARPAEAGPPGAPSARRAALAQAAGRGGPPRPGRAGGARRTAYAPHGRPRAEGRRPSPAAAALEAAAATEAHRRELARLAWPEAAGTTPEQREALELAVRHGLAPGAVAAVLGLEPATARELLAAAACEVERTRAALAVVESGNCPTVGRLTGDHRMLLSATLRRELVRHVDDCPRCRRAAERAGAQGPWPGEPSPPPPCWPWSRRRAPPPMWP